MQNELYSQARHGPDETFTIGHQLHTRRMPRSLAGITSRRPRLKIKKTLTVHAPLPATAVRAFTTSSSGSLRARRCRDAKTGA